MSLSTSSNPPAPQPVTVEVANDTAWITIDDGKVNVMSASTLASIEDALAQVRGRARVSVLRGRPGVFSAGFDLKTFAAGDPEASRTMVGAGVSLIAAMLEHPHPIVAVCTGHAYPMGAFLLLSADYRIGVQGDFRMGLNEVAIALTVPEFAVTLARHRLSPPGFARLTTGALMGPEQALAYGYLDEVVDAAQLDAAARSAAVSFLALDPKSYVGTKARVFGPVRQAVLEAAERDLGAMAWAPA